MEMQQVRYFVALSRELNFTRAAQACNVTQPALTRAIQALEAELGGPLFHRERAQTHLSELGRIMSPYIETMLQQVEAAQAHARAIRTLDRLDLKIGAMCTISPALIADFIVRFHEQNVGIDLDVSDAPGEGLCQRLDEGALEVGVMAAPEPLHDRFHAMPLFQERFVVVLPPGHRLAERNVVRCADLNAEAYVNRINCESIDFIRTQLHAMEVRVRYVFRSERDDWVIGMIRAGLGLGLFPEFFPFPDDIVTRPLIDPEFVRTVSLVTVRGRPHSPAVGAFVRGARAHRWPDARQGVL
jgi:DNA-binding transcriptional LysR family regulator